MYHVFSDGGCKGNPGPGGWGAVIQSPESQTVEKRGNMSHTTNNQMELTGAIEALKATPKGCTVKATTDSQYVIKGMSEWIQGWKRRNWVSSTGAPVKNIELWKELDIEVSARKVSWQWVKGHAGHPENERCDELANQAIAELSMGSLQITSPSTPTAPSTPSTPQDAVKKSNDRTALGIDAVFEL